jgi:polyether ionophore transport system permease protein
MSALTGTRKLVRLILRRDRVLMLLWVPWLALVPLSYVASLNAIFPSAADKQRYAEASAHNAAFVALYGRLFGASLGELVAWRAGFIPVIIGLFSILAVIRHTRAEEETGRRELLGATVVGRHAGLAAALAVMFAANLVIGVLLALGMISQGLPAGGSWAFGAEFAAAGWVFAAVAALAAQLTSAAGSARAIAIVTLGGAYVLRLVGDISGSSDGAWSWLSWLSPLGWVHRIHPYGGDRWWPVRSPPPSPRCSPWWRSRCPRGATSARACCRPGSAGLRQCQGCARRWRWRGGCTAACWPAGPPGSPCSVSYSAA